MTSSFSSADTGADTGPPSVLPVIDSAGAACTDSCITCGDVAVEVDIVRLLPRAMALVTTAAGEEEVSIALVRVSAGDTILVHAGEAIAVIRR